MNTVPHGDYTHRDMTLQAGAARYECGTLNTIGCYGLRAAMEFLLEVGVERIGPKVQALGDQIEDGVRSRGCEILGQRTAANGAGIVSFRKAGIASTEIVARLARQRIVTAARAGWVRASPHFYITEQ